MGMRGSHRPRLARDGARGPQWFIAADHADALALHRMIGSDQPAMLVDSGDGAHRALQTAASWHGIVIDMSLGHEAGMAALTLARRLHPRVPAAMMATGFDQATINGAFVLGAGVMCKPIDAATLAAFTSRCATAERLGPAPSALIRELARQHALSPREAELLVHVVSGDGRDEMLRRMGITENTLKTHTRSLLRKLDARHLSEVTIDILRAALNG